MTEKELDPRIDDLTKRVKILERKLAVVIESINNHHYGDLGQPYLAQVIEEIEQEEH